MIKQVSAAAAGNEVCDGGEIKSVKLQLKKQ